MVTSQARFVMRIVDLMPCSLLQPNTPLTLKQCKLHDRYQSSVQSASNTRPNTKPTY
jgi:hypothetical protein